MAAQHIAFYGKAGGGTSTVAANVVARAGGGRTPCDPDRLRPTE